MALRERGRMEGALLPTGLGESVRTQPTRKSVVFFHACQMRMILIRIEGGRIEGGRSEREVGGAPVAHSILSSYLIIHEYNRNVKLYFKKKK